MSENHNLGDVIEEGVEQGHKYKVVQNPRLGHFCGYVQTNFGEEWHFDDLYPTLIECHGGLTYGVDSRGYVGFDCAHAGDVCYLDGERVTDHAMSMGKEWRVEDVEEECIRLARQIDVLESFVEKFQKRGWGE